MSVKINQPIDFKSEQYKIDCELAWNKNFGKERSQQFSDAQAFIDRECIILMVPYTPAINNVLYESPVLGTEIGSGEIYYLNPYARYQYYGKLMVSSVTGSAFASAGESKVLTDVDLVHQTSRHALAGPFWFERMKKDKGEDLLKGAAKITGGTPIG